MGQPTILVTGAGSFCAVNILKSLRQAGGYRVITTDIYAASVGAFCSDQGYLVPREGQDGQFIEALVEICRKEKVDLLIPGFDSEIPYISAHRKKFQNMGVKIIIGNESLVAIGNDKLKLADYLKEKGFPYLKSFELKDHVQALKELGFPVIVKPKSGWGQRGFHQIADRDEFDFVLKRVSNPGEYMIQEFIDGEGGEFTNSVSTATDGEIMGCICTKRELVKGDSRKVIIDEFSDMKKQMINIAQTIGSPGPMNLQCRVRDGKAYVFEINARFSTTNIIRAAAGYNEVALLVENFLTGKKGRIPHYQRIVALAHMDYVYVNPEDIDQFEQERRTHKQARRLAAL
jgi:carbamoyl-phosphate synthase large subunit